MLRRVMRLAAKRNEPVPLALLGPLEMQVLEALWERGRALPGVPAREVLEEIGQPLAYTTVTTTLDRLCRKNLVMRVKADRAFLYAPRHTRRELDELEARRAVQQLSSAQQLASCLVDAVAQQDVSLLDELEETIRRKRRELKRSKP